MSIRVLDLLRDHGIDHRLDGPNCASGNVVIKCPWCGNSDPSQHMGISLESGAYGCWRNDQHRGGSRSFPYLVAETLSISLVEARKLCSQYSDEAMISGDLASGFRGLIAEKVKDMGKNSSPANDLVLPTLEWPREWMQISPDNCLTAFACKYLYSREFSSQDLKTFPLYTAMSGRQAYRIIFPVTENGVLVAYTGRGIREDMLPRYRSIEADKGGYDIKDFVGFYDHAISRNGKYLVVVEGPMDALKMNVLLGDLGSAVCLFGKTLQARQRALIVRLSKNYEQTLSCLDEDAWAATVNTSKDLAVLCNSRALFPHGFKDPGVLTAAGLRQALSELRS